jgi:glycosyltransferase involved in cell wall biosynthesis
MLMPYALLTSAKNEVNFIGNTIKSVLSQVNLPTIWYIVSDGSTDGTDEAIKAYADIYDFIKLKRIESSNNNQGFSSKVFALKHGYEKLYEFKYKYIGILDADITINSTYYQDIMLKFENNPRLGISGGYIYEMNKDGVFVSRKNNRKRSVAGAVQLFRRECFEEINGLQAIRYGGEDTYAEIMARYYGWEVEASPEYKVFHHKPGHLKRGIWKERIRMGRLDYVLGYQPAYEVMKCMWRIPEAPILLGAIVRMWAYFGAMYTGIIKIPPPNILRHIRKEQWDIVRKIFTEREVS